VTLFLTAQAEVFERSHHAYISEAGAKARGTFLAKETSCLAYVYKHLLVEDPLLKLRRYM
jgi:hypothetical protein